MNKNVDLIVHRVHNAYCVQLTKEMPSPQLFWSPTPYSDDLRPLGPMQGQEVWIRTPDSAYRPYFAVRSGAETCWAADTAVEIGSVENFRDMGGYRTQDGRTVKWGRFFRCGAVAGMNEQEMTIYKNMHIRSIFDYRAVEEAAQMPDVYTDETAHHLVPAMLVNPMQSEDEELEDMDMATQLQKIHTAEDGDRMYASFQTLYATLPFGNKAYVEMLKSLDSADTVPMIQHCSAGKDRTGVGCALVLLALGVDEDTVLGDYMLSAIFRERVNEIYVAQSAEKGLSEHALALVARMMTVAPDMLGTSLREIKARYPSYEAFLEAEYGVTAERRAAWRALHTV